jgi:hypothetical protein
MEADMDVDVLDHGSASRTFHMTAQSGSHVLIDYVLKNCSRASKKQPSTKMRLD